VQHSGFNLEDLSFRGQLATGIRTTMRLVAPYEQTTCYEETMRINAISLAAILALFSSVAMAQSSGGARAVVCKLVDRPQAKPLRASP
jgi:hypothetical protein